MSVGLRNRSGRLRSSSQSGSASTRMPVSSSTSKAMPAISRAAAMRSPFRPLRTTAMSASLSVLHNPSGQEHRIYGLYRLIKMCASRNPRGSGLNLTLFREGIKSARSIRGIMIFWKDASYGWKEAPFDDLFGAGHSGARQWRARRRGEDHDAPGQWGHHGRG